MQILVVDDNAVFRKIVSDIFDKDLIVEAKNGKEGLVRYQANQPDFVITDVQMPVMDGPEMGKCIRRLNPKQPIIYMTADDQVPASWRSFQDLFSRVIKKPSMKNLPAFKTELLFKIKELQRI